MWSPAVKEPLVKMLTHRGPLISLAIDNSGLYVISCDNASKLFYNFFGFNLWIRICVETMQYKRNVLLYSFEIHLN